MSRQPLLNACRCRQKRPLEDALFLEARKQVGEELRLNAQVFTLERIEARRRIEWHRDRYIAKRLDAETARQVAEIADREITRARTTGRVEFEAA